jgi:hypothetical protein
LRRIELPGLEISVKGERVPEPVAEPEVAPDEQPRDLVPLVALTVVVIVLGLWLGLRLGKWYQIWRHAWLESEGAAFRHVNAALRSRDPNAISAAVMRWLDRLDPGARPARLDLFLADHGDDLTRDSASVLATCLASGDRFAEGRQLSQGLKSARQHLLRSRRNQKRAEGILPELNG